MTQSKKTKKRKLDPLALRLHKGSGQGYVLLDGVRHYIGRYDDPGTKGKADRLVAEYLGNGRRLPVEPSELSVSELCNDFRKHIEGYYIGPGGKPGKEVAHFGTVIKAMRSMYGPTKAAGFGPRKLKAVRQQLVSEGRSRIYVNKLIVRLKMMFKWAVGEEMLDAKVHHALQAVAGLKRGRTTAKESEPVQPVPVEHVEAIRCHVSRQVAAMMDLQLLTAARQGELCIMRSIDVDMTGKVWVYVPKEHKNTHLERDRKIYLGPKAQAIVQPFLKRPVEAFLFSPAEAEAERLEERNKARKTLPSCGNTRGSNRVRSPRRTAGPRYTSTSYARAIARACKDAAVPAWHPHQLRHTAATELRKQYGLDVAAIMLGHARCDITQVYAERNHEAAIRIAGAVG